LTIWCARRTRGGGKGGGEATKKSRGFAEGSIKKRRAPTPAQKKGKKRVGVEKKKGRGQPIFQAKKRFFSRSTDATKKGKKQGLFPSSSGRNSRLLARQSFPGRETKNRGKKNGKAPVLPSKGTDV